MTGTFNRRSLLRAAVGGAAGVGAGGLLSACGSESTKGKTEVVLWTQLAGTIDMASQQKIIKAIEKKHPDISIRLVRKPGSREGDNSKLIAAVRGRDAPDLVISDRFAVSQQAAMGLLRSLDPYMKKDGRDLRGNYLPFAINEATYNDELYALPFYTDTRGVFFNRKLLREAKIDVDRYDSANGPLTIDEMMSDASKITKKAANGNYERVGLIPWDAQGHATTWAMSYGAKWFDNAKCEMTLEEPAILKAFQFVDKWGKELDYQKIDLFKATYQPPNAPPTQTPFFTDRLGMNISGNWDIMGITTNAPKLDWGVTYLPVGEKGDDPFTWAGGFAMSMPNESREPEAAWTVMKDFMGEMGQRIHSKEANQLPTFLKLIDDKSVIESSDNPQVNKGMRYFADGLTDALSRPPLPVGGFLWESMETAKQAVLLGDSTPEQAQQDIADRIKTQTDIYCPFTIPTVGE